MDAWRISASATEDESLKWKVHRRDRGAGYVGRPSSQEHPISIPIVMAETGDPVGQGFVAGLARPGGNITGTSFDAGTEIESVFAKVH